MHIMSVAPRPLLFPIICALLLALAAVAPSGASADHGDAAWTALLARHVHWNEAGTATAVDYDGFARDRAALDAYLAALAAVPVADFERWPRAERMAFLINAYNAATVALVLDHEPGLASIKDIGGWFSSPWKQRYVDLFGATRTLDEIEHELLRGAPDFDEPRIHFAVNCASIGCPALRPEAYAGDRLAAQLDDQTRRFLRDRTRNRVLQRDPLRVGVSSIFDWYGDDFDSAGGVHGFLARYPEALDLAPAEAAMLRAGDARIEFLDYDWTLNDRPRD